MKTIFTILITSFFSVVGTAQGISTHELLDGEIEPGKAYGAFYLNDTALVKDSFYLELVKPVFKVKELTVRELYDLGKVMIDEKSDKIVVEIRPTHLNIEIETQSVKGLYKQLDFAFSFYDRMVFHKWFEWDSTKNENGQATFSWETILPVQVVKQHSQIRLVDKATAENSPHEIYVFPQKYVRWSEITLGCRVSYSIRQIQEKLIEKGYDCPLNNILDKATKQAVIQFQEDNHLPIGRLDHETLTILGIF